MAAYAAAMQKPLVITGLTQQSLPLLQAVFPEQFTLENDRDSADYLYRTADFRHSPERSITKSEIILPSLPSMLRFSRR